MLATGKVQAQDIAIAATSTQDWDDHLLAHARSVGLPLPFSHGVSALSTTEGQDCAALADILANGVTQEQVWRLIRRLRAHPFARRLPPDWFVAIPRSAGLHNLDQGREVLAAATRTGPLVLGEVERLCSRDGLLERGQGLLRFFQRQAELIDRQSTI